MPSAVYHALPRCSSVAPVSAPGPAGRDFLPDAVAANYILGYADETFNLSGAPVHSSLLAGRCIRAFVACVDAEAKKLVAVDKSQASFLHDEAIKAKSLFLTADLAMHKLRLEHRNACMSICLRDADAQAAVAAADCKIAQAVCIVRDIEDNIAMLDIAIECAHTGDVEGRRAIGAALRFVEEVNKFGDKELGLGKCQKLAVGSTGRAVAAYIERIAAKCCHKLTGSLAVAMPEGYVAVVEPLMQATFALADTTSFQSLCEQVAAAPQVISPTTDANATCSSPSTGSTDTESEQASDLWTLTTRSSMTSVYSQASMCSEASSQPSVYSQESAAPARDPRRVPSALFEALAGVLDPLPTAIPVPRRCAHPSQRPIGMHARVTGSLRPVVPPPAKLVTRAAGQRRAAPQASPQAPSPAVGPRDPSQWGAPVGYTMHRGPVGYTLQQNAPVGFTLPSSKEERKGWRQGLKAVGRALKRLGRK
ncbi:hypothetical protein HDZ31DRAFT_30506 [Schizophyllum fasciatum]